jgi:hypothetical protein
MEYLGSRVRDPGERPTIGAGPPACMLFPGSIVLPIRDLLRPRCERISGQRQ